VKIVGAAVGLITPSIVGKNVGAKVGVMKTCNGLDDGETLG
jgi:hypothetical protein